MRRIAEKALQVRKQIKHKEKLAVYEEQYEVIGNHLCKLEHDKDLLNRFRLHEEQHEQGFQQMDSGKIPQIRPQIISVENPSKKHKISQDPPEVVIEEGIIEEQVLFVEVHGEFMEETPTPAPTVAPASVPTTMPTVAATPTATPAPVPTAIPTAAPTAATSTAMASSAALAPRGSSVQHKSGRCTPQATGQWQNVIETPSRVYYPNCSKDFKFEKGLKEHLRDRCGKTQKMFQCGVCQKEFHHEQSLLYIYYIHIFTPFFILQQGR